MSAGALQHPAAAEHYADHVLMHSKLAIFRLHGGRGYFPHLLDEIQHIKSHGAQVRVLVLPGTDQWDAELLSYSDYAEPLALRLFDYFREGGLANYELAAQAVERLLDNQSDGFPEPVRVPTFGWYEPWKQTTA
jgi:cobaltochelatase CobN